MGGLGTLEGGVPVEVRMRGGRCRWRPGQHTDDDEVATKIGALLPAIAWVPFFLALATPGTAIEDEPGHLARVAGVPANLVPATLIPIISALGYTLHRHAR